ncbi:MAG TPA: aminoglycoside adenylyltransferase domain-containing protein [Candidatus Limnocylindrales bacterium]|nr:aminoglycoside adenylyltransferase domain-containing protein [Candidatus Limnocylindrales bacterium]
MTFHTVDVTAIVSALQNIVGPFIDDLQATLGPDLVGVYLYGSAITGGFDPVLSDLDLLVVIESDARRLDLSPIEALHDRLAARHPDWADRLDIAYVGRATLATFRAGGTVASISHEDALQLYDDADGWLQTWYLVQFADTALLGPPVAEVIPPIERAEFVDAVARDADRIVRRVETDQRSGLVAYTLLTLCRVLRTIDDGAITSKPEAASWVAGRMPEARWVLDEALVVRASGGRLPFSAGARVAVLALVSQLGTQIRLATI